MTDQELINLAVAAREFAYAPYSKFFVGAAILGESGKVYSGCNIENASYGLTNCAERVAIANAISQAESSFALLAISVKGGGSPCGACRQVINEFCPASMRVLMADENGILVKEMSLGELLPDSFGPESL